MRKRNGEKKIKGLGRRSCVERARTGQSRRPNPLRFSRARKKRKLVWMKMRGGETVKPSQFSTPSRSPDYFSISLSLLPRCRSQLYTAKYRAQSNFAREKKNHDSDDGRGEFRFFFFFLVDARKRHAIFPTNVFALKMENRNVVAGTFSNVIHRGRTCTCVFVEHDRW